MHHIAYQVSDIASELERLRAAGIELIDEQPRVGRRLEPHELCLVSNHAAHGFKIGASEIQRATLARAGLLRGLTLNLYAAHAHFIASGRNHQLVARRDFAVEHRAGDDSAAARDGEGTIGGVTKMLIGAGA